MRRQKPRRHREGRLRHNRRTFLKFAGAAAFTPAMPAILRAQAWPSQTIKAIVPFTAGSTLDVIGRIVLNALAPRLGQTIVVENRGGAGGTIGSAAVARSAPDGYTLLINASAHSAAPAAYPKITYDPAGDFAAVAMFGSVPNVTIVNPEKGFKTLADLVAEGRKRELVFSSAGVGSATHWAAERLKIASGIKARHLPFRGGPEATNEVAAGRVDFACMGTSSSMGLINAGKLHPLAVSTPQRSSSLPNVPTTIEAGFANSDYTFWNGMFAPAKTPRAIIERLHKETMEVLALPDVRKQLLPQAIESLPLKPQEFDALVRKEIEINKALVKAAGLKFG